ncbi:hypothetical protein [Rhodanobacter sp. L36]|uniref:hypothetical protein n=1 Tax=Rhodanobacter sp. L36 TaxID=1747221 RepID=UPI00131B3B4D|nr:hypothetical protein [Rhodanobacter sp. L36]
MKLHARWTTHLAGIVLLVAGTSAQAATHRHVQSALLHAGFDIDSTWHQKDCGAVADGVPCVAYQTSDNKSDLFYISSKALPLDDAMTADVLFAKDGKGGWTKSGRMDKQAAERIEGKGWKGWRATADCGIEDENGVHDTGECMTVFVSNGQRTIIVETSGTVSNDDVLGIVVSTLSIGK